jgi:hypothetical protein
VLHLDVPHSLESVPLPYAARMEVSHGARQVWKKMRIAPRKARMWCWISVSVCESQVLSTERSRSWARDQVAILSPRRLQVSCRDEGRGRWRDE